MPRSRNLAIFWVIILILFVALGFVAISFFSYTPGIIVSCKTGEFINFGSQSMPPFTILPPPSYCEGSVTIVNRDEGSIICQNNGKSESYDQVFIPCPELKNNKNENVIIEFMTYSTNYGNFSQKTEKIY